MDHVNLRKPRRRPSAAAPQSASALTNVIARLPTSVKFTNLDKVLYPERGFTKASLVAYYALMADSILPYVAHRPLTLFRCPDGIGGGGFFQKHPRFGTPRALERITIEEANGESEPYVAMTDVDALLATAQYGALELHVWGARSDKLNRPDTLVFNLDPDPALPWAAVTAAARDTRDLLDRVGLVSFVKTTGGKGLHVVVPIDRKVDWAVAKDFTRSVAAKLVAASPARYTANPLKAARKGKIFVDYLRNDRGSTAVAPYSSRANARATVATPVSWNEIDRIDPSNFDIVTVPRRTSERREDPWTNYASTRQSITATMRKTVGRARR